MEVVVLKPPEFGGIHSFGLIPFDLGAIVLSGVGANVVGGLHRYKNP